MAAPSCDRPHPRPRRLHRRPSHRRDRTHPPRKLPAPGTTLPQITRVFRINQLETITDDVIEAVTSILVIGDQHRRQSRTFAVRVGSVVALRYSPSTRRYPGIGPVDRLELLLIRRTVEDKPPEWFVVPLTEPAPEAVPLDDVVAHFDARGQRPAIPLPAGAPKTTVSPSPNSDAADWPRKCSGPVTTATAIGKYEPAEPSVLFALISATSVSRTCSARGSPSIVRATPFSPTPTTCRKTPDGRPAGSIARPRHIRANRSRIQSSLAASAE